MVLGTKVLQKTKYILPYMEDAAMFYSLRFTITWLHDGGTLHEFYGDESTETNEQWKSLLKEKLHKNREAMQKFNYRKHDKSKKTSNL